MNEWYPQNKEELNSILDELLNGKPKEENKNIHGLIVPHAGYAFSGKIAGKAFSLLKNNKNKKVVVIAPSHYVAFRGIASLNKIETPLGEMKIIDNDFPKLKYEHAIDNQIPFLQKLNIKEILPIAVGQINAEEAEKIARQFLKENAIFIFSTDLSHFLEYNEAIKKDLVTIDMITNLKESEIENLDACGFYPLLILFKMCKIKSWKPKLIEYKNSGDITGDKTSVVGYASFVF